MSSWIGQIANKIQRAWIRPPSAKPGIDCVVHVTQVPGGAVTSVKVGDCNGDAAVRQSIEDAQAATSVWESYLGYLVERGHPVPPDVAVPDPRVQEILIAAYREDPDAGLVAERLVDLDEGVQEWRYRHVKMVERTIGTKRGTGGSSGVEYLRTTLFQPAFPDLWEIRSRL